MPKNIHTPREELICGRLDKLMTLIREAGRADMANITLDIMHDAERMEAKLVSRRDESVQSKNKCENAVACGMGFGCPCSEKEMQNKNMGDAVTREDTVSVDIHADLASPATSPLPPMRTHHELMIDEYEKLAVEHVALKKACEGLVKALEWAKENAEIILEHPSDYKKYCNKTIGVCEKTLSEHRKNMGVE